MIKKLKRKIKRKMKRVTKNAAKEYFKSFLVSASLHLLPVGVIGSIFYFLTWR